jgi:beta-xylosidase
MKMNLFYLICINFIIFVTMKSAVANTPIATPAEVELPKTCYIFSYFVGNGEDGLHLAWSRDGLKWHALNEGKSFLTPTVGGKLMRDPCITVGPDGVFHMVWTDSWHGTTIGYASSTDLIHWSQQKVLSVMKNEPTTRNCWAPEIIYDSQQKQFLIFWASTIPGHFPETEFDGKNDNNHRIYATTTRDFNTFTPSEIFFNPGFNVIDSTLMPYNGTIYMFFKDETKFPRAMKNLRLAAADDYKGPYAVQPQAVTAVGPWLEGPSALKVGDFIYLYYDAYKMHHYGALRSRDLKTWENVTGHLSMPRGIRHGTAFAVSAQVIQQLLEYSKS